MKERTQLIINAIIENDKVPKNERLSQEKLGERFGVTGPRISQIRTQYIPKAPDESPAAQAPAEASVAVVEGA